MFHPASNNDVFMSGGIEESKERSLGLIKKARYKDQVR
jgi:hypothetical protein